MFFMNLTFIIEVWLSALSNSTPQIYTWKYNTDVAVIQSFLQQLRVFDTDICAKLVLDLSSGVPCILYKQTSKETKKSILYCHFAEP